MTTTATGVLSVRSVTIDANSTNAVTGTIDLPEKSEIIAYQWDNVVAWDSATTATGTIGTAAAGTQYIGSINAKTAGSVTAVAGSAAQSLQKMYAADPRKLYVTVTPSGATTVGKSRVSVLFTTHA